MRGRARSCLSVPSIPRAAVRFLKPEVLSLGFLRPPLGISWLRNVCSVLTLRSISVSLSLFRRLKLRTATVCSPPEPGAPVLVLLNPTGDTVYVPASVVITYGDTEKLVDDDGLLRVPEGTALPGTAGFIAFTEPPKPNHYAVRFSGDAVSAPFRAASAAHLVVRANHRQEANVRFVLEGATLVVKPVLSGLFVPAHSRLGLRAVFTAPNQLQWVEKDGAYGLHMSTMDKRRRPVMKQLSLRGIAAANSWRRSPRG